MGRLAAAVSTLALFATVEVQAQFNFKAVKITASAVTLMWKDYLTNELGFVIERAPGATTVLSNFVPQAVLYPGTTNFIDTAVAGSSKYSYRVGVDFPTNGTVMRKYSGIINVTTPTAPDLTPPTVAITSPLPNSVVKGTVSILASASDRVGVSKVEFLLDGTKLLATDSSSPYSYSLSTGSYPDGVHTLSARAWDAAKNVATATIYVTFDKTVPPAPTGLQAYQVLHTNITFTWTAPTDLSGIKNYRVFRNGTQVGTPVEAGYADGPLSPNVAYCYTVSAVDGAGNVSPVSAKLCLTTPSAPDLTPPTVPGGVLASVVNCGRVDVRWTASTDGHSGVKSYRVYRDGSLLSDVLAPTLTVADLTVAAFSSYSYEVSAVDAAGNESARSAAVSAVTPACPDTIAPPVPGTPVVTVNSCSQLTVSWPAVEDVGTAGIRGYMVYRNGYFLREVTTTSMADSGLVASTSYLYNIRAVDKAGNISGYSAGANGYTSACPDTTAPTTPLTVRATVLSCGTIAVSWMASVDYGGSGLKGYDVFRNGTFLLSISGTNIMDGTVSASSAYTYSVRAVDNAGNASSVSPNAAATTPECPDTVPPTVPGNLVAVALNCREVAVSWSPSSDAGSGVLAYQIFRNGSFLTQFGATISSFTDTGVVASTAYNYTVRAVDGALNISGFAADATVLTPGCPLPGGNYVSAYALGGLTSDYNQALKVDPFGNAFVGGSVAGLPYVAKVDTNGVTLWSRTFGGYGSGSIQAVTIDPAGNIIVGGYFYGSVDFGSGIVSPIGGYDMMIVKLDQEGRTVWARTFGSPYGADWAGDEAVQSLATDAQGNIVATGGFYDVIDFGGGRIVTGGEKDIFLLKLDVAGQHVWSLGFGGIGTDETGTGVATDKDGNIFLTGRYYGNVDFCGGPLACAGAYDIMLVKYSPTGAHLWSRRMGGSSLDSAYSVAVDPAGNPVVCGTFRTTADLGLGPVVSLGSDDMFLAKYSGQDGSCLWAGRYGDYNTDTAFGVDVDAQGNMYLTGRLGSPADMGGGTLSAIGFKIIVVAKYTPTGQHVWSKAMGAGRELGRAVSVLPDGHCFVTGNFSYSVDFGGGPVSNTGNNSNPDMFLLHIAP
jgi:chitodextrinase